MLKLGMSGKSRGHGRYHQNDGASRSGRGRLLRAAMKWKVGGRDQFQLVFVCMETCCMTNLGC